MALIQWDGRLSVHITEIDKQHQNLIGIINDFYDAMSQGKGKDVLGETLNELINYAVTHFKTEEKYFDQFGYPESTSHKQQHADFMAKVSEFKTGFDKGETMLTIAVMNFLVDWLQNHIKNTDKKYTPFFNEKGLK